MGISGRNQVTNKKHFEYIMRKILFSILFAFALNSVADSTADSLLITRISSIEGSIYKLNAKVKTLEKTMNSLDVEIEGVSNNTTELQSNVQGVNDKLEESHSVLLDSINKTNDKVFNDAIISTNTTKKIIFYGCGCFLVISIVVLFLYVLLTRRLSKGLSEIDMLKSIQKKLDSAHRDIETKSIKLENRLIEFIENQMSTSKTSVNSTPDHSLVLKVADEIVRIELNLSRMDPTIKGYKQLTKGVERIKDNFKAKGYEITDMLGKTYVEGMKVVANFVLDETLPEGSQIITGIIKPQIIYNGTMIQAAEITVSQNI